MSAKDTVKMKGEWFITLYGPEGQIKDQRQGLNMVTSVGKEFIASFLYSAAVAPSTFTAKYIGIGTGTNSESASDTALYSEQSRHTGTVSYVSNQIFQIRATFATGSGTGAITEFGLFTSNSVGTMIARDLEDAINKGANDTLTVIAQMTLS
jgi:hypothetical protein